MTTYTSIPANSKPFQKKPRDWPILFKLLIPSILLLTLLAVAISLTVTRQVENTLTAVITENFVAEALTIDDQISRFFLEKVSQLQVLAVTDVTVDALAERNQSYTGNSTEIQAELEALDAQWQAAAEHDPFITAVSDETLNPVAHQIADFEANFPDHKGIFVTDRYGATLAAPGEERLDDYYHASEAWWQAVWNQGQGAVYITDDRVVDEHSGAEGHIVAVPIYDEASGEFAGAMYSVLETDEMVNIIANVAIGQTGYAVLFKNNGEVLYEPRLAGTGETGSNGLPADLRLDIVTEDVHAEVAIDEHGELAIFGHAVLGGSGIVPAAESDTHEHAADEVAPAAEDGDHIHTTTTDEHFLEEQIETAVANLGWAVLVRQETYEAFASINTLTRTVSLLTAVAVIVLGLIMAYIIRLIVQPIQVLDRVSQSIAAGNFDTPLPQAGQDEIGRLTYNFGQMSSKLQQTLAGLEQRVAERTQELEASAQALATTGEVSRQLSTILDEQELVTTVVEEVQKVFHYYHAHIYLTDKTGDTLLMAGGTGEAGAELLAQGHHIPVGKGLVGRAAANQTILLVPDVSQEEGWLPNPLLPDTKAEVAVPIAIGDKVLGVLDVQHNVVDGLQQRDADLLASIAAQVASAVQNARAYQQAQYKADREARVNVIRQQLDQADSVERVMQVAVRELGRALGAEETRIRLQTERENVNGRK